MESIADFAWLTGSEADGLLRQLADSELTPLRLLESLRRELSAERARLIVEQLDLRRRATEKFGDDAARMFFTRTLLEQATDRWISDYKAERLGRAGAAEICDYCCGLGGDLLGLARRGPAAGWDASETACRLAAANCGGAARIHCGDANDCMPTAGAAWHIDPDRRPGGRRTIAVDGYSPGPETINRWLVVNPCGAAKLAPAAEAPAAWQEEAECEWMSRDRQCRQQVVWFGPLAAAPGGRRATLVRRDGSFASIAGRADLPCDPVEAPAAYLYDPDPSVLAAGLLGTLAAMHGWRSLGAGGSYLTGDDRVDQPLAAGFAVLDCLPLRTPTLARYFAARGVGSLEICKRGVATAPELLRRQLKLRGDNAATVVLTRIGRRETAIVVERFSP